MRDWDLEIYSALLKRPGLCMGTNDWNEVENFIRFYELGSKWECNFKNLLTDQLFDKYEIRMPSSGLIEQLKLIAIKTKTNWDEIFIQEAMDILRTQSDGGNQFRFQKILRNKILNYFQNMPDEIDSSYFMNLNQINRQVDDWHGQNLTEREIKMFKEIKEMILFQTTKESDKVKPTQKLRDKIIQLKEQIKNES